MKPRKRIFIAILLILICLVALAKPTPVSAALGIASVTPNLVVNDILNEITISGSDFTAGMQVSLGATVVTSTFVDANTLEAIVPPGFAPGIYTVTVTSADMLNTASLPGGLTVVIPTPIPTATTAPPPTATTVPFARPQIVLAWYSMNVSAVRFGQEFDLSIRLYNGGGLKAYSVQVNFTSTDLLMLRNGGVAAMGNIDYDSSLDLTQTMTAAAPLAGRSMVSVDMNVTYYHNDGAAYVEKFILNLPVAAGSGGSGPATTPTPRGIYRSQLVITGYSSDLETLQPGDHFKLSLTVSNNGNLAAKGVTMIVGGGSASGSSGGTPQSGGISAGSGEFSTFAPVGSSNVQSLGDFDPGASRGVTQQLVVNVSASPGAYPVRITFSYTDERGNSMNDEQVVTLLVYRLPQVEVSFYQPVEMLFVGQPGLLPLQLFNLGRQFITLGNLTIETDGGMIENGQALVGGLDMGGFFTLDSTFTPGMSGSVELTITIEYYDDFNQPRTITQTLTVQVEEYFEPEIDPNLPPDGGEPIPVTETFWQKLWRFILGLLGLDSSVPSQDNIPVEPMPEEIIPMPVPGKG